MDLVSSSEPLIDDLLEDYWFFKNLFTKNSRVLRYCHSDPYPSSSSSSFTRDSNPKKILEGSIDGSKRKLFSEEIQDESLLEKKEPLDLPKSGSCSAPGKIQEASTKRGLIRAPSLPPLEKREMDREAKKMITKLTRQFSEKIRVLEPTRPSDGFLKNKEAKFRDKKISESSRRNKTVKIGLHRTQTMPCNIPREDQEDELEDQESDSRMGFLIREALSSSQNVPKVTSNHRQRPPRNMSTGLVKQGSLSLSSSTSTSSSPKTLRKTLSSIETTKEIQRMKDCYYDNEPRGETGVATPPRVPKDSRKEMKDQIKFWARAVASNVRQEC